MSDEIKKNDFRREYSVESINFVISAANEDGLIVSLNHPNWSIQRYEDYAEFKGLWAVEFYNTRCVRGGHPETIQHIDDLLAKGQCVFPIATDDAHSGKDRLADRFVGFTIIKAEELDYDTVFSALEKGYHYSSSGPLINELYIEDGVIHISTSDTKYIEIITERRYCRRKTAAEGEAVTESSFDVSPYIENCKTRTQADLTPCFRIAAVTRTVKWHTPKHILRKIGNNFST